MSPTELREIEKSTTVYDDDLEAYPITWRNAGVKRLYGFIEDLQELDFEGNWYYYGENGEQLDAPVAGYIMTRHLVERNINASMLPVEFFNHELMAVDPDSEPSVYEFVKEWGFPYAPSRNPATAPITHEDWELENHFKEVCKETGELTWEVHEIREDAARAAGELDENESTSDDYGDSVISFAEASLTIRTLQDVVKSIWAHFREGERIDFTAVNRGSCHPYVAQQHMFIRTVGGWDDNRSLASFGLFTSAICNQIIETIADNTPWRDCACEGCEVIFKRKQAGSLAPYSESIYCCKRCEERQKKRNQRKAARNRMKH